MLTKLTRSGGAQLAVQMGAKSADHLLCVNDSDIKALANSKRPVFFFRLQIFYMNCPYPQPES